MTFEKFAELDWWMKVYAAVVGNPQLSNVFAETIADHAVEELRARIPANRKWKSDVLWAQPAAYVVPEEEKRCNAHQNYNACELACELADGHEGAHRSGGLTWY